MKFVKDFMKQRYGTDQLSLFLLVIAFMLTIFAKVTGIMLFGYIGYIPFGIAIFRFFSKEKARRSMENYKFFILINPLYLWWKKLYNRFKDFRTHKVFKCTNCKKNLRVPRGRGKIIVTCPRCKNKFQKKS